MSSVGGGVTRAQRVMKYGEPRALPEHRSRDGYAYRRYCQHWLARALPPEALPTLREAGLANLDLARLRGDLEQLGARTGGGVRRKEARRLRAEIRKARIQLVLLERRLEKLASRNGHRTPTLAEVIRQRQGGDGA